MTGVVLQRPNIISPVRIQPANFLIILTRKLENVSESVTPQILSTVIIKEIPFRWMHHRMDEKRKMEKLREKNRSKENSGLEGKQKSDYTFLQVIYPFPVATY